MHLSRGLESCMRKPRKTGNGQGSLSARLSCGFDAPFSSSPGVDLSAELSSMGATEERLRLLLLASRFRSTLTLPRTVGLTLVHLVLLLRCSCRSSSSEARGGESSPIDDETPSSTGARLRPKKLPRDVERSPCPAAPVSRESLRPTLLCDRGATYRSDMLNNLMWRKEGKVIEHTRRKGLVGLGFRAASRSASLVAVSKRQAGTASLPSLPIHRFHFDAPSASLSDTSARIEVG